MKTYKVINPLDGGIGKSTNQKVKDSIKHYGVECKIVGGEYSGYGNPEYSIIETEESIDSEFMQSIAWNTTVKEIV